MSLQQKIRKLILTFSPTPKWPAPVQVPLDDDKLPDEVKILVSEGNVESIIYYGIGLDMMANHIVTYKGDFWIERDTNKKQFKLKN